jgi:hypothetical protein
LANKVPNDSIEIYKVCIILSLYNNIEMSIDENIYRAARFRRSITENDEIAKIAWIHSSDFQLDRSIVTVRMADYMNRRIYAFECVINKKGCDVGKLIEAQHSHSSFSRH